MKLLIARYSIVCLFGLLLTSVAVQAARLDNLFLAEVDAAGRDSASRDAALALALQEVLVRVTGSADSISDPLAQDLLNSPGRYVEQFRFRSVAAQAPDQAEQLRLWVQFDAVALAKEVRRLGLPYWGHDRPDVLVWLAIDDRGRRYLVSETAESETGATLSWAAGQRGLPLSLPLMDLEDQRAVQFTDVWGGFLGSVEAASQRYRPQVILVGKLGRSTAGGWRAEWSLIGAGGRQAWSSHANELEDALVRGVAETAEWLATQYAVVASDETLRRLSVEGIQGLQDYARVYNYLASLTPVKRVQVARVQGQEVEFNLKLSAEERNLLQVITLGKLLQAVGDPSSWRFRLNP